MSSLFLGKVAAAGLGAKLENRHSQAAVLQNPRALTDRMVLCVEACPCIVGCLPGFVAFHPQPCPSYDIVGLSDIPTVSKDDQLEMHMAT